MRCGRSGDWACTEDKVTPARNAELVKRQSVTRQISGSTSAQAAGAVLSFRLPDGEQEQANSAFCCRGPAQVAKSVDARDLKSLGLCRAGSSPALGTTLKDKGFSSRKGPFSLPFKRSLAFSGHYLDNRGCFQGCFGGSFRALRTHLDKSGHWKAG